MGNHYSSTSSAVAVPLFYRPPYSGLYLLL